MKVIKIGRLIYSDCGIRCGLVFGSTPAAHLFWRFWWKVKP